MSDYEQQHIALVEYLRVKVDLGDWHAVSDAANDLRVLEARQEVQSLWDRIQPAYRVPVGVTAPDAIFTKPPAPVPDFPVPDYCR